MHCSAVWRICGRLVSMACWENQAKGEHNASKRQEHCRPGAYCCRRLVAVQEGIVALGRLRPNVTAQNPEEAVGVYEGFYGELPVPATAYANSATRLTS